MKHMERTTTSESEAWVTISKWSWSLTGWKADLLIGIPTVALLFCFVVGVVTVAGWVL